MLVTGVVEAPNGAHFTSCVPDYGRDEAFQRAYVRGGGRPGPVGGVQRAASSPGTRPGTSARSPRSRAGARDAAERGAGGDRGTCDRAETCVIACAEAFRGDGEILASPIGLIPVIAVRLARHTFEPLLLVTDGEATS